jgi:hypothetical protein
MSSKYCPTNEHAVDRAIRVVLGIALLSLTVIGPHALWGLIGLVPLLTGLVGSCPLYTTLGLSTTGSASKGSNA